MQDFTCSPYGGWVYFTGGTRMWVIPDREFMLSRAPEEMAKDLDRWIKDQNHLLELHPNFTIITTKDLEAVYGEDKTL